MKNTQRGRLIAYYRRLNGMTQKDLADKIGLTAKAVSAWETGRNEPNMGQAYDIAAALDVDITDLMQPQTEPDKKKDEVVQLLAAYEKADEMTRQMVRRILGIKEEN